MELFLAEREGERKEEMARPKGSWWLSGWWLSRWRQRRELDVVVDGRSS